MKHKIKCRFCNKIMGELELTDEKFAGKTPTNAELGIADSRCDSCSALYGDYKKMCEQAEQELGMAPAEAKKVVEAAGFKKDKLVQAIADKKAELEAHIQ